MAELIDGMPRLIQAGMGVHVSCASLANLTSRLGALGVVSGVGMRHVVAEQIRAGDEEAIAIAKTFPLTNYVDEMLSFAPGGSRHEKPVPMDTTDPRFNELPRRLSVIGAYVEVMRAKKGHLGKVGINIMWKCALSVLPTVYGAMIAGVDALLGGAGIPMEMPDIIKKLRAGENLKYTPLAGTGSNAEFNIDDHDAASILADKADPKMIPILSNFAFAKRMLDVWEREHGGVRPFAFVLENHAAGGHNAPPRNKSEFGSQDDIDRYFDKVLALDVPVYVAGAFPNGGNRTDYEYWTGRGAYGLQVGSRFALCNESGLREDLKDQVIALNVAGESVVITDNRLSPTGYPFKYVPLKGTLSDPAAYESRKRVCNRGYLFTSIFKPQSDGSLKEIYICPAMPEHIYLQLGGTAEEMEGRVCLCNTLLSTGGFYAGSEHALVTLGQSGLQVKSRMSAREIVADILTPEYTAEMEKKLAIA